MTWIKLNNNAVGHPKVAALSDRAFRWWIQGLCYAGEFLTDGLLPPVFWKKAPTPVRSELTTRKLWDWIDPNFQIHDYLHHQNRKEDVEYEKERNRAKAAAYRSRKREEKNRVTEIVTGDALPKSDRVVPNPDTDNRLQITDYREQRQKNGHAAAAPLITSPMAYERRKQQCAFVGARLEVPHALHGDLRKMLGGLTADADLQAWYLDLDEEIEASGEPISPDVFKWLKARYAAWAKASGEQTPAQIVAAVEAMQAARRRPS